MNTDKIKDLQTLIDKAQRVVFFGGAGVSTESNIPDFRSSDGLYNKRNNWKYPVEHMLSHSFFVAHTEEFFDFYRTIIFADAMPNTAHKVLAEMEKVGKLSSVITQNIDGLHQKAGSKKVFELHGSVKRNYCTGCKAFYDENYILNSVGVPKCKKCGATVKPDVVLYEEPLDNNVIENAIKSLQKADLLIVAGTSLSVYPAASLIYYFGGDNLVLINKQPTGKEKDTTLFIQDSVGSVLGQLKF